MAPAEVFIPGRSDSFVLEPGNCLDVVSEGGLKAEIMSDDEGFTLEYPPKNPVDLEEAKDKVSTLYNSAVTNTGEYISLREQLREARQWTEADTIRSKLGEQGIALEDTPNGTRPKHKR